MRSRHLVLFAALFTASPLLAADAPLAKGERIVFLGDSITQGWEKNGKEVWEKKSFTIYGASVYICPPIPFSELQGSPREAIEKVRLSIEAGLKKITPAGLAS